MNMHIHPQIIEAASWRIVSQFCRRYAGQFHVLETFPGGGMYDCLSLYDVHLKKEIADFNRAGSFHVFHRYNVSDRDSEHETSFDIWPYSLENDLPKVLDKISDLLGLPIPKHRPASTPEVIVYRFMSAMLAHSVFGLHKLEWSNGFCDTSGYGGGVNDAYFEAFPEVKNDRDSKKDYLAGFNSAYRFWFLKKDNDPVLSVSIDGTCWQKKGDSFDLRVLYGQEKRMWPILNVVAGDLIDIEER